MLVKIQINGTTVKDDSDSGEAQKIRSFTYDRTFGEAVGMIEATASMTISDIVTLSVGQLIEVWRGWTTSTDEKKFSGYIERFEPEGSEWKIISNDKLGQLVKREVTHVYDSTVDASAGKISEIFKDLVTTYGGLTADGTSVQDSGTTLVLNKFICRNTDIFERCKKLADTLDWQFYYRADTDKVYFEPKGYTNNTTVLQTGTNIAEVPKWRFDTTEMINELTLVGAEQLVETTQLFSPNGTGSVYTLNAKPASVKTYLSSTLQSGGIYGQSNAAGTQYLVDFEKKTIIMVAAPASGENTLEVRYAYAVPTPVFQRDDNSIALYQIYSKTMFLTDVKSVTDAEARAQNILAKYAQPFTYAQLKIRNVSTASIEVGQTIRCIDTIQSVDKFLEINRYIIRYPNNYDEIYVGDKEWRLSEWQAHVMEKLQRLEEETKENQDFILQVQSMPHSLSFQRTSLSIWGQGIGSAFILSHANNGILGSFGVLGDYRTGSDLLYSVNY